MMETYLPAWCERSKAGPDGRYFVACYFNRDGHPVSRARAERVELVEYAPDGTALRLVEATIDDLAFEHDVVFSSSVQHFTT